MSTGNVDSVNSKTGIVSLNTDDIPEGTNKYFNSGITTYKANNTNTANELLKLDGTGLINT